MNSFGRKFRVSVSGESHGQAVGVVLDGVPAGIMLSEDDFAEDIRRRKSGAPGTTPRIESDLPHIMSGVCDGVTTGAPMMIMFENSNTKSSDYEMFRNIPRPGHADFTASLKWNAHNDLRGGGHFSGRLTLPVVAAGVVAKKILASLQSHNSYAAVSINARITALGGIPLQCECMPANTFAACNGSGNETKEAFPQAWKDALENAVREGDSLGAVVECVVEGIRPGLGEPFWDSVESMISHAVFSIPGVRGIEFGDGFAAAGMKGSEHNDPICPDGIPKKNGAGGINGGLSNGAPIVFRVAFKPTSSIRKKQLTADVKAGVITELSVPGRHDACFALRAPVVVEAMAAIVLADYML